MEQQTQVQYALTHLCRFLFDNLTSVHLHKHFLAVYGIRRLVSARANRKIHSEPHKSSPHSDTSSLGSTLILSSHLCLGLPIRPISISSVLGGSWNLNCSVTEGSKVKKPDHRKVSYFLQQENIYCSNKTRETKEINHLSGTDSSLRIQCLGSVRQTGFHKPRLAEINRRPRRLRVLSTRALGDVLEALVRILPGS